MRPLSILLVHGAANSSLVWAFWQRELGARGRSCHALDLRGHGNARRADLSRTSMEDYAADVVEAAAGLMEPPVLMGWSMGGLAVMMAAAEVRARACIALAPSAPARRVDESLPLREGEFGPEEYGITGRDPADQAAMPDLDLAERAIALASLCRESRYARDQRARGIVIERLSCPLLLVTGGADEQWPEARYKDLHLRADWLSVAGASHWGLVLSRKAVESAAPRVAEWLTRNV